MKEEDIESAFYEYRYRMDLCDTAKNNWDGEGSEAIPQIVFDRVKELARTIQNHDAFLSLFAGSGDVEMLFSFGNAKAHSLAIDVKPDGMFVYAGGTKNELEKNVDKHVIRGISHDIVSVGKIASDFLEIAAMVDKNEK